MCKKEYNNAVSETAHLKKENDKLRTKLVHAKESLVVVKKENDVLMNSIPQIHR